MGTMKQERTAHSGTERNQIATESPTDVRGMSTYVYIIALGDFIKIGVSVHPAKRLAGLKAGTPERPILYATRKFASRKAAFVGERIMHHRFQDRRGQREWFKVSPAEAREHLMKVRVPTKAARPDAGRMDWLEIGEADQRRMVEALLRRDLLTFEEQ